jgi:hypothetical protein
MPARDTILIPLISKVLIERPGLGVNELYKAVTPLYCDKTGLTKLSNRHFLKYLGLMKDHDRVEERGRGKRGKQELYLTDSGKKVYNQQSFDLPSKITTSRIEYDISPELKALYTIILYFNGGVSYKVNADDAAQYILRSFGIDISSLVIRSEKSIVKSESGDIMQDILQSVTEDATIYEETILRSDIHQRGTKRYRIFLHGITCESVHANRNLKAFRYLKFTSEDIRNAIHSLCSLNVLSPMGSLGPKIDDEIIYKIDKSIFDIMFGLRTLNGYDIFDKIESIMKDIWSRFRPPTESEKTWLYFVFGHKEADQLIINAHDSRDKITNGESMKSYISKIRRNDKEKLAKINKKIELINEEINEINDHITWVQESYKATINKHKTLINNMLEIVYPEFFATISLDRFSV